MIDNPEQGQPKLLKAANVALGVCYLSVLLALFGSFGFLIAGTVNAVDGNADNALTPITNFSRVRCAAPACFSWCSWRWGSGHG
jgi:hypothetical protein